MSVCLLQRLTRCPFPIKTKIFSSVATNHTQARKSLAWRPPAWVSGTLTGPMMLMSNGITERNDTHTWSGAITAIRRISAEMCWARNNAHRVASIHDWPHETKYRVYANNTKDVEWSLLTWLASSWRGHLKHVASKEERKEHLLTASATPCGRPICSNREKK